MNTCVSSLRRHHALLPLLLMLLPGLLLGGPAGAGPGTQRGGGPEAGAPAVVSYQGVVTFTGSPYNGTGYFKFAVVDAAGTTSYWSNDGTSSGGGQPTASVALAVAGGQFTVLLGDTTLAGMTQALTPEAFTGTERYLRVWFSADGSAFTQLAPDLRVAAVPYALQAADSDLLDGYHASAFQQKYAGVVVVAKSGGDYGTVQAAINSITTASATNPYLVWVAPGVYTETVAMKPYVHVQGAGQDATVIGSTVSSAAWPPQATVALTRSTSLRDVTVRNMSTAAGTSYRAAVVGRAGVTGTLVADVTAQTLGAGSTNTTNCALALFGPGTSSVLQDVSVLAESAATNYGLYSATGAAATLRGGAYTARGGADAHGIYNSGSGTTLVAGNVTVLAENATQYSRGLHNISGAAATLQGGAYAARGGYYAHGISSTDSGTRLTAENVVVLAEGGTDANLGLRNAGGAAATLRGGSFTASGGAIPRGIYTEGSGTTLVADNVTAHGEGGSNSSSGLHGVFGVAATLRGGSYTARGGVNCTGIYVYGGGTTLVASGITATGVESGVIVQTSAVMTATQSTFAGTTGSIYVSGGTLDVSNSRLVGTTSLSTGTLICTAVSSGTTFYTNTCP